MKQILVICTFSLIGFLANSQSVSGYVKDGQDHHYLPFVSIIMEGTTKGTISDIDGYFRITPEQFPITLQFHTLGYLDTTITYYEPQKVKVSMFEKAQELGEAVILPGENPAIPIIKKAIENRQVNNPQKNHSFTYDTYSKMVFGPDVSELDADLVLTDSSSAADSSKYAFNSAMNQHYLFLTESVSERKFMPPNYSYEKVTANRFSGLSNPTFTMIATEFQPFSYYSDYVDVIGFKYLSPLARNSFKNYVFELKETLVENGDSIFIIYFQPRKGSTFNGLIGTMAINNNLFAIQNIKIKQANPGSDFQIAIEQMSEFIDEKQWFPVQFNTHLKFFLDEPEAESQVGITHINARGKTYIKNIKVDVALEKKDFPNVQLEMTEESNTRTDEFWEGERKEKLNSKEVNTYVKIDSIGDAKNFDKLLSLAESWASGLLPIGPVSIELRKALDYNEVEGFRAKLGVRTNEKVSKYFSVGAYAAYGFRDEEFKYGGDLKLNISSKNDVFAGVKYVHDVTPTGMVDFHKKENFNLRSYSDLYISKMDQIEGFEAYLTFRSFRDFQNKVFYNNYDQSYSYDYTYLSASDTVITQGETFKRSEIGWSFRFGYKEKYIRNFKRNISMGTKFPYLWVRLAVSDELLGSKFKYQKVDAKISKNFRIKGFGKIGFQLTGGSTLGEVPLSFLSYGAGMRVSGFNLYIENGFNTMAPNEFVSQTYASGFLHYSMGALYKSKYSALELSLVTAVGWGSLDNPEYHLGQNFSTMEKGYYESGLLLDKLLLLDLYGFGMGVFYRYGPYALPQLEDNFGFSFTILYDIQ
ncbi:MAG: DUF5686 family protein [Salibacteraceae bacterium]